jgi:hypothetical protein
MTTLNLNRFSNPIQTPVGSKKTLFDGVKATLASQLDGPQHPALSSNIIRNFIFNGTKLHVTVTGTPGHWEIAAHTAKNGRFPESFEVPSHVTSEAALLLHITQLISSGKILGLDQDGRVVEFTRPNNSMPAVPWFNENKAVAWRTESDLYKIYGTDRLGKNAKPGALEAVVKLKAAIQELTKPYPSGVPPKVLEAFVKQHPFPSFVNEPSRTATAGKAKPEQQNELLIMLLQSDAKLRPVLAAISPSYRLGMGIVMAENGGTELQRGLGRWMIEHASSELGRSGDGLNQTLVAQGKKDTQTFGVDQVEDAVNNLVAGKLLSGLGPLVIGKLSKLLGTGASKVTSFINDVAIYLKIKPTFVPKPVKPIKTPRRVSQPLIEGTGNTFIATPGRVAMTIDGRKVRIASAITKPTPIVLKPKKTTIPTINLQTRAGNVIGKSLSELSKADFPKMTGKERWEHFGHVANHLAQTGFDSRYKTVAQQITVLKKRLNIKSPIPKKITISPTALAKYHSTRNQLNKVLHTLDTRVFSNEKLWGDVGKASEVGAKINSGGTLATMAALTKALNDGTLITGTAVSGDPKNSLEAWRSAKSGNVPPGVTFQYFYAPDAVHGLNDSRAIMTIAYGLGVVNPPALIPGQTGAPAWVGRWKTGGALGAATATANLAYGSIGFNIGSKDFNLTQSVFVGLGRVTSSFPRVELGGKTGSAFAGSFAFDRESLGVRGGFNTGFGWAILTQRNTYPLNKKAEFTTGRAGTVLSPFVTSNDSKLSPFFYGTNSIISPVLTASPTYEPTGEAAKRRSERGGNRK